MQSDLDLHSLQNVLQSCLEAYGLTTRIETYGLTARMETYRKLWVNNTYRNLWVNKTYKETHGLTLSIETWRENNRRIIIQLWTKKVTLTIEIVGEKVRE